METCETWFLLARDRGHRRVLCNSDSREAIRLIYKDQVDFHRFKATILDIRSLLTKNWESHPEKSSQYCKKERHLQLKQAVHHSSEKVTRFYFWHTVFNCMIVRALRQFNRERALSLVNILLALVSLWGREHWDV